MCLKQKKTVAHIFNVILVVAPIVLLVWFALECYLYYTTMLRYGNAQVIDVACAMISLIFFFVGALLGLCAKNQPIIKAGILGAIFMIVSASILLVMSAVEEPYRDVIASYYTLVSTYVGIVSVLFAVSICLYYLLLIKKAPQKYWTVLRTIILVVTTAAMTLSAISLYQAHPYSGAYQVYRALHEQGGYATATEGINYSFAHASQKLATTDDMPEYQDLDIKLAKNEWEGLQFVVSANRSASVSIELSAFCNENGQELPVTVTKEHYVDLPLPERSFRYRYPDGLIPITKDDDIVLTKDELQAFYIETRSTASTEAGEYVATLTLYEDSNVILKKEIVAEVWDFTLPEGHYSKTAVGLDTRSSLHEIGIETPTFYPDNVYNMLLGYGYNTWEFFYDGSIDLSLYPEVEEMYLNYYNYVLDHGMSANFLPYDLLDTRVDEEGTLLVDKYLDDPRVTSFCIPYPREDDEKLIAYYEKATSKPEWAEKAYFYPVDEPGNLARKESYMQIVDRLDRLFGADNYNLITPFYETVSYDWDTGEPIEVLEMEKEHNSWICPQTYFYGSEDFINDKETHKQNGGEAWWYVCNGPTEETGFCNLFIHQDAIKHRILFWQQYDYDVDGFLYYFVNVWPERGTGNPWNVEDVMAIAPGYGIAASGDGTLIYPGADVGTPGIPAATIRLNNVTAGLEDYDYLKMAEEKIGREAVDALVDRVTQNLTSYTDDYDAFEAVRREIGELLAQG